MKTTQQTKPINMKAVTVPAPLAFAMCEGFKDIENRRTRPIQRAGLLAIHAAARQIDEGEHEGWMRFILDRIEVASEDALRMWFCRLACNNAAGTIVGYCHYEVLPTPPRDSVWYDGKSNAMRLTSPRWIFPLDPIHCRGQVGVWSVNERIAREVLDAPCDFDDELE